MTSERRAGPGGAEFERLVGPHRAALLAHCYRMTGSLPDAEDAVQETLIRAWRAFDSFEGRSSLRTWLYSIATNAARRVLEQRRRRVLPVDFGPPSDPHGPPGPALEEAAWVTPFPGVPDDTGPAARYESRESVELAFVAALQALPGRQRAALLMRDVLGFTAAETAEALESSVASANSALGRARRTLESRRTGPAATPAGERDRAVVDRFVAAWVAHDVDALVALLAADVEMTMPPMATWYRGRDDVATFLRRAPLAGAMDWRSVEVEANGRPGFALYSRHDGTYRAHSVNVLTVVDDVVTDVAAFLTPEVFPGFGLPMELRG